MEFTITKEIGFDYGHRVPDHASKCASCHGHRARLECTVAGTLVTEGSANGMVMDFSDIKRIMMHEIHDRLDHRFIFSREDPLVKVLEDAMPTPANETDSCIENGFGLSYKLFPFGWVQEVAGPPTAENLAYYCYKILSVAIDIPYVAYNPTASRRVVSVRFWETPTSVAEYKGY